MRSGLCARTGGAVPLMLWPFRDLDPQQAEFEAVNLLAVSRMLPLERTEVDFRSDDPATSDWKQAVVQQSLKRLDVDVAPAVPDGELTRGEFARRWWDAVAELPRKSVE